MIVVARKPMTLVVGGIAFRILYDQNPTNGKNIFKKEGENIFYV
jgi:hypothetical protein